MVGIVSTTTSFSSLPSLAADDQKSLSSQNIRSSGLSSQNNFSWNESFMPETANALLAMLFQCGAKSEAMMLRKAIDTSAEVSKTQISGLISMLKDQVKMAYEQCTASREAAKETCSASMDEATGELISGGASLASAGVLLNIDGNFTQKENAAIDAGERESAARHGQRAFDQVNAASQMLPQAINGGAKFAGAGEQKSAGISGSNADFIRNDSSALQQMFQNMLALLDKLQQTVESTADSVMTKQNQAALDVIQAGH